MVEIAGEFRAKQAKTPPQGAELSLPSVVVEGIAIEQGVANRIEPQSNEEDIVSPETEDSLVLMLEAVDDELRSVKTRLRSAQEMALKYASNAEVLARLNGESKFFQRQYDELLAKKDVIMKKINTLRVNKAALLD